LYKGIYGKNNKVVNINLHDIKKKSYTYTGIYDQNILCKECDNEVISKLETYCSNTIYFPDGAKPKNGVYIEKIKGTTETLSVYRFHNLDYTKTKLFFLSILWRAHLSKHPFFKDVELGKYAGRIREMLITNNAGEEDELEVVLILVDSAGTRPDKSIISPRYLKENGNSSYIFHINQIMYHFNISRYNKISLYEKGLIKKDGILDIGIIEDHLARGYFDDFMGKKLLMKSNIKR
jgi:hypothetical protein